MSSANHFNTDFATTCKKLNYPRDAIHVFAENRPVNEHNNNKLEKLPWTLFQLRAADQYPKNVSQNDIDKILLKGRSETGGLDYDIFVKIL